MTTEELKIFVLVFGGWFALLHVFYYIFIHKHSDDE